MSDNYFKLLNFDDTRFDLDLSALERNYIDIQYDFHPDRFFSVQEKESAVRHMAKVNEAYFVLKSPIKRAEYILGISGIKVSEEDRNRIIVEVLDLEPGSTELSDAIAECTKGMESSFSEGDMYNAAVFTEKLKYLNRISKSGGVI